MRTNTFDPVHQPFEQKKKKSILAPVMKLARKVENTTRIKNKKRKRKLEHIYK